MAIGDQDAYDDLRADLGVSDAAFPNDVAEYYFIRSDREYPNDHAKMVVNTRVLVIQGLIGPGIRVGKYTQNQSVEDFTAVASNLRWWLEWWTRKVAIVADPVDSPGGFFFTLARGRRGQ